MSSGAGVSSRRRPEVRVGFLVVVVEEVDARSPDYPLDADRLIGFRTETDVARQVATRWLNRGSRPDTPIHTLFTIPPICEGVARYALALDASRTFSRPEPIACEAIGAETTRRSPGDGLYRVQMLVHRSCHSVES
jgi:hypothetical protein